MLLMLPVAVAWRYRDRARIAGIALGVAVAAKLFVWPLVVWLLLTRRFAAAVWAVGLRRGARLRRVGARRVRRARRLSDASARRPGRLCRPQHLVFDRRRRPGASVSLAVALSASPGIACLGVAALLVRSIRRRPPRVRRGRRRVCHRVADRVAELRRAALRADRDRVAAARAGVVLRLCPWLLGAVAPRPDGVGRLLQAARRARAGVGLEPHGSGLLVRRRDHGRGRGDRRRGHRGRVRRGSAAGDASHGPGGLGSALDVLARAAPAARSSAARALGAPVLAWLIASWDSRCSCGCRSPGRASSVDPSGRDPLLGARAEHR